MNKLIDSMLSEISPEIQSQAVEMLSTIAESLYYVPPEAQSELNAQAVRAAVRQRFPEWAHLCIPYRNVLTFQEWKRRGYRVRKGERSIRIPILREIEDESDPTAKRLVRRTACLFAQPQVEQTDQ